MFDDHLIHAIKSIIIFERVQFEVPAHCIHGNNAHQHAWHINQGCERERELSFRRLHQTQTVMNKLLI